MRSSRRKLTDEEKYQIAKAYTRTDESVHVIAQRFGIHRHHIPKLAKRMGLRVRPQGRYERKPRTFSWLP